MIEDLKQELDKLALQGRLGLLSPRLARKDGKISIKDRELIDLTSWDVFDLNHDARVKRALQSEVELNGISAASSRLVSGTSPVHLACEIRLARFLGAERAVLFSSRNQACLSLIASIAREGDCVLVDDTTQNPAVDAAYLVNAEALQFSTRDLDSLERIAVSLKGYRRKFMVVESLSPIDGKTTDLLPLLEWAHRNGVFVVVDESYGLGLLGLRGSGGMELLTERSALLCQVGSLALAASGYGAFVAGSNILCDYLINRSRTFSTEVVIPACLAAAIEQSIDIIELDVVRRERLKNLAQRLSRGLNQLGLLTDEANQSSVICIPFLKRKDGQAFSDALFQRGYLTDVVSSTALLSEGAVVRMILTVHHTERTIDELLQVIAEVKARAVNAALIG